MRTYDGHIINCEVCGILFRPKRSDARLCSGKCRMKLLRKCNKITAVSAPVTATPRVTVTPEPAACADPIHKLADKLTRKKTPTKKAVSPSRKARFMEKGKRLAAAKAAKKGRAK